MRRVLMASSGTNSSCRCARSTYLIHLNGHTAAEGVADGEKDAARLIIELGDGSARHTAGEFEMAEGALDPSVHRHGNLRRHGKGQAGNALPARPEALAIIDGRSRLAGNPEVVAPLELGETEPAADKGRHRRVEFEIVEGIDHHRIVP